MRTKQTLRSKNVLKRMGEYSALGLSHEQIGNKIHEEFGLKTDRVIIGRILKTYEIRRKELIHSDEKLAEIYKKSLLTIFDKVNDNLTLLENTRAMVTMKMDQLKKDMPSNKMIQFSGEITKIIRTQNDTLRTMMEWLKRLEIETKEIRVSTIKQAQVTISQLQELENEGMIKITRDFHSKNQFSIGDENE